MRNRPESRPHRSHLQFQISFVHIVPSHRSGRNVCLQFKRVTHNSTSYSKGSDITHSDRLDEDIAQGGSFNGTRDDCFTGGISDKLVEESVLYAPTNNVEEWLVHPPLTFNLF